MTFKRFLVTWNLLFLCVICDVIGIFIIKIYINKQGPVPLDQLSDSLMYFINLFSYPIVILGAVMFFAAPFLFAMALSRMEVSTAYPVQVGLNFALLVILAVWLLGESLSFYKIMGLVMVAASILCLLESESLDPKDI